MKRQIQLNTSTSDLIVTFPYDQSLVEVVREMPRRRWDPKEKHWTVPIEYFEKVHATFKPLSFEFVGCEELLKNIDESPNEIAPKSSSEGSKSIAAPALFQDSEKKEGTYCVSDLNNKVRNTIKQAFMVPLWLQGEVVGYDRNKHKQHVYFQLAEKSKKEDRPLAVVTAVLFGRTREKVEDELEKSADPIEIQDGLKIRVLVRVDLYAVTGSYQVIIEAIDPEFTLGDLALRQRQVLAELEKKKLIDRNSSLPFPLPALRIGLITSYESDAYNDFVNEVSSSGYAFEIDVMDCHVQGEKLEEQILGALSFFEKAQEDYDVIVIVRGGGSRTDLMGFDSLPLAMAVAQHPLKVMIGVGHHRDRCVLDFIAHSEKTPTAVAQSLVSRARNQIEQLSEFQSKLSRLSQQALAGERERLDQRSRLMARTLDLHLSRLKSKVESYQFSLAQAANFQIRQCRQSLVANAQSLRNELQSRLRSETQDSKYRVKRLSEFAKQRTYHERQRLEKQQLRVKALDPRKWLEKGYAYLVTQDGTGLRSVEQAKSGDEVYAQLADGKLDLKVLKSTKAKPS